MCSINCTFVGENNFNIIKMHCTTIKIKEFLLYLSTARLKNYIRVILQEVGELHMVNRILNCGEICR
jgi:hypothetical protein